MIFGLLEYNIWIILNIINLISQYFLKSVTDIYSVTGINYTVIYFFSNRSQKGLLRFKPRIAFRDGYQSSPCQIAWVLSLVLLLSFLIVTKYSSPTA